MNAQNPNIQNHAAEEAARYPTNHIIAVVNDQQEAQRAADALREVGFTHVELLSGAESLRKVHQKERAQNPLARLWESARESLTETEASEQLYLDALQAGHCVVMAGVANADDAQRADDILRRYHAYSVQHFGSWTVTNLSDAPPK